MAPIYIIDPKTAKRLPVPKDLAEILKALDQQGRIEARRYNGVFEPFVDAPLSQVGEHLAAKTAAGLHLTAEDKRFLKEKLGIDPDHGFSVDRNAARRWLGRRTLFESQPATKKQVKPRAKVRLQIAFDAGIEQAMHWTASQNRLLRAHFIPRVEKIIDRLAEAAELDPTEVPTKIVFTNAVNNVGLEAFGPYVGPPACSQDNRSAVEKRAIAKIPEDILKIPLSKEIVIRFPAGMLSMILTTEEMLDQARQMPPSPGESAEEAASKLEAMIEQTWVSPLAGVMAHEFVHMIRRDPPYLMSYAIRIFTQYLASSHVIESPEQGMCAGLVASISLYGEGVIPQQTLAFAAGDLKPVLHTRELDASRLGHYLMVRADFALENAGSFWLPKVGESLTHPAERLVRQLFADMAQEAQHNF